MSLSPDRDERDAEYLTLVLPALRELLDAIDSGDAERLAKAKACAEDLTP